MSRLEGIEWSTQARSKLSVETLSVLYRSVLRGNVCVFVRVVVLVCVGSSLLHSGCQLVVKGVTKSSEKGP